jgi:outer membrane lipase/esterase
MTLPLIRRALLLVALLTPGWTLASPIELVIFGDSMSDTGNMSALSSGLFSSRYSNGDIWVDHFASEQGLTLNTVYATGSLAGDINNFAAGGAYSGSFATPGVLGGLSSSNVSDTFVNAVLFPGLQEQVAYYGVLLSTGMASPEAWHVVWAGGNDLLFADLNASTAQALAPGAVANVRTAIETLAAFGATQFLIPNLADIGLTPFGLSGARSVELSAGTTIYNAKLALMLDDLETLLGINTTMVDMYSLVNEVAFGIQTDASGNLFPGSGPGTGFGPCLVNSVDLCTAGGLDPNDFLSWDGLHPTSRAHGLISDAILDAKGIPEPTTLLLLVLGLGGVYYSARRRTA